MLRVANSGAVVVPGPPREGFRRVGSVSSLADDDDNDEDHKSSPLCRTHAGAAGPGRRESSSSGAVDAGDGEGDGAGLVKKYQASVENVPPTPRFPLE